MKLWPNLTVMTLTLCLFAHSLLFAQGGSLLDILYRGGRNSFMMDLSKNLRYPSSPVIGTSLVEFTVSNGELISMTVLNSLGKPADNEVKRVLKLVSGNWKNSNSTHTFTLPVTFKQSNEDFFVDPMPADFLGGIVVVSYPKAKTKTDADAELVEKANANVLSKNYEKAIPYLEELIRRNPVNIQIREARASCYAKLGKKEAACADIAFLDKVMHYKSLIPCE